MISNQVSVAPLRSVAFGSCQERKLFPTHYAPNRLGNQTLRQQASHLGPGCHENHELRTMMYEIQTKPESKKGYVLSARTAARFLPCNKTPTPSPQKYQQDQTQSKVCPPGQTPFSSTAQRFKTTSSKADGSPGPGTYAHDTVRNRKVTWPMRFGSPDWSRQPQLEKRSLRVELDYDKEFKKQRARLAYLSLYY
ncbi:protein pitchfork-like [Lampris incognitus]|uniref:protein pitchfork-like n=1 Tax=Lampris incognitus TaxID=2546036 RepID=UPI0024B4859C|nr:protein pitchfork-like [Lampris incognitus]